MIVKHRPVLLRDNSGPRPSTRFLTPHCAKKFVSSSSSRVTWHFAVQKLSPPSPVPPGPRSASPPHGHRAAWIVLSIGGETRLCRFGRKMSCAVSARSGAPVLNAPSRSFSANSLSSARPWFQPDSQRARNGNSMRPPRLKRAIHANLVHVLPPKTCTGRQPEASSVT
jgi:hypothetical protein